MMLIATLSLRFMPPLYVLTCFLAAAVRFTSFSFAATACSRVSPERFFSLP